MTPKEAREILLEWLRQKAHKVAPLVWASEAPKEDESDYLFDAALYAQGENPEDNAIPHAVNKQTGRVEVRALLY